MTPETFKTLSPEIRTKLLADLRSFDASAASALELRKQAFLDTYSVKVLDGGPHQVSFTIPEGKSRMDLINDAQAAAGLVNKAEALSVDEMSRRLDGALRALRGEEVSTSGAATTSLTTAKTSLQVAQEMVDSYSFDTETGVSTFTVPSDLTDVEAMKALNEYFRKHHPSFDRDAVYAGELEWYQNLPQEFPAHCQARDYSQARQVTITGVVDGTTKQDRATQEDILKKNSLVFSDPRDQALAASIHACKHQGENLFKDLWVRGSVPGFALSTSQHIGVDVRRFDDDHV